MAGSFVRAPSLGGVDDAAEGGVGRETDLRQ
jgi:hypothetical protein